MNLPQQNAHWSIGQKIFVPPLKLYVLNHCQELRLWKLKNEHLKIFFEYFWVKIGCHSCFDHECNTERGFIDSLYIALGFALNFKRVNYTKLKELLGAWKMVKNSDNFINYVLMQFSWSSLQYFSHIKYPT